MTVSLRSAARRPHPQLGTTRPERYALRVDVHVPRYAEPMLASGSTESHAWFIWQSFPDLTPQDLADDVGDPWAYRYAQMFALEAELPFRVDKAA